MIRRIFPGILSREIKEDILNDNNVKEWNEDKYMFPQELYVR
jgi:hypothetical protein